MFERKSRLPEHRVLADLQARGLDFKDQGTLQAILHIEPETRLPDYTHRTRKKPPVTSKDLSRVQDQVGDARKALGDRVVDPVLRQIQQRRAEIVAYELRRKATKDFVFSSVAGLVIFSAIAVIARAEYVEEHNEQRAYENSITLNKDLSVPSYKGWSISDAEGKYVSQPGGVRETLGTAHSIRVKIGDKKVDTGVELDQYKTVDGKQAPQLQVFLEDPDDDLGEKVWERGDKKKVYLMPERKKDIVVFTGDDAGEIAYVRISRIQDDDGDPKFLTEQVKPVA